jgi:hemerythrin
MALMEWSARESVGLKSIDDQHAVFIAMLNELHSALMKGELQSVTGPLLGRLVDFSKEHFSDEEKLMGANRYPELARHRDKHTELTEQLAEFVARYERSDRTMYLPMLHFLRDWLNQHLQEEDQKFASWFKMEGSGD